MIFPVSENRAFLLVLASVCCRFCNQVKQKVFEGRAIMLDTNTSAVEQSTKYVIATIESNGRDCDISAHDAIAFTRRSKIGSELPTFW